MRITDQYAITFTVIMSLIWGGAQAQPQASGTVKLVTSGSLIAGPSADAGRTKCQPLRGDLAEITGDARKASGTEVFPLRMVNGLCVGTTGWAGAAHIETATSSTTGPSGGVQFASSNSLFEAITPKMIKGSCQPLRGDGAEILESTRFSGTEVYRVAVLSGRCQGTKGWVGSAHIERHDQARNP